MLGEACCFTILYVLLCLIVIFPPDEIAGMGLTVEKLLASFLGSEIMNFVQYHQRRTTATVLVHSLLIPGYLLWMRQTQPGVYSWMFHLPTFAIGTTVLLFLSPVLVALCLALWWHHNNWSQHPLSKSLTHFLDERQASHPHSWLALATEINIQYRRVDKLSTQISSTSQLVAIDSWLIQVNSYQVCVLPLEDTLVVLEGAINNTLDTRPFSAGGSAQILKLRARCVSKNVPDLSFRLSSTLMSELERKLVIPVLNSGQVVVQKSLADQFLEVFLKTVSENPPYLEKPNERREEACIGCMSAPSNVKLDRRCRVLGVERPAEGGGEAQCVACSCRPMWFAARQDQARPETWLSSRAPCPTCRSLFCLLDVRLMMQEAPAATH
ncbi:transmembrane protein 129 isoform X4 [Hyalella azteca]|uniref:Transmembrane protein 129 isoform X4 n=1 Tax=Hyalella azteca TaxID=294128 RepID=A0A979FHW6_HYAAZ|nr:transmembrane protein 129 isoform X4 [Hyalella azteca]